MTEAWTHQFNSEADFLDFLKMRRELEELRAKVKYLEKAVDDYANDIVKKNETIGELRRTSSPIECYVPITEEEYQKLDNREEHLVGFLRGNGSLKVTPVRCKKLSLPPPVESGVGEDYSWWTEQQLAFRWWNQIGELKRAELRQKYYSKDIIGIYNEEVVKYSL